MREDIVLGTLSHVQIFFNEVDDFKNPLIDCFDLTVLSNSLVLQTRNVFYVMIRDEC